MDIWLRVIFTRRLNKLLYGGLSRSAFDPKRSLVHNDSDSNDSQMILRIKEATQKLFLRLSLF